MAKLFYRHILLRGFGVATSEFQATGRSSVKKPSPVENRADHAETLRTQLDKAEAYLQSYLSAQKNEKVPINKRGMPITITARPDVNLVVGTARSSSPGLKLFSVRRRNPAPDSNDNTDQATFFVTTRTFATLKKNLEAYAEWLDDKSNASIDDEQSNIEDEDEKRPKNFWLFESGASIRVTTLRDLWTDAVDQFPRSPRKKEKWEVWIRKDFQGSFFSAVDRLGAVMSGGPSEFIESVVRTLIATPEELQQIVQASAAVIELRSASSFVSDFFDMIPEQRATAVTEIKQRVHNPNADGPRVAILDTGVNRGHILLADVLPAERCYSVEPSWGTTDTLGHGTKMAGLAQYDDLTRLAPTSSPIVLTTSLESVVVTAPQGMLDVPARTALKRAVDIVERDPHLRIFCLAQTAQGEAENGTPTSTSAVLDQLAYGDGNATRLFCAAVGNVPYSADEPYQIADYSDRNARFGIQSPAQALNVLSVGAVSLKATRSNNVALLASKGDLAPTSRTAANWPRPHIVKPDIVMEGGNFAIAESGNYAHPFPRSFVLTTSSQAGNRLSMSGETSTATALAAGLAARLLAQYPSFRMETIRGLMVHAAEWTQAMHQNLSSLVGGGIARAEALKMLFDRFGWGVPDAERLFSCASNNLTLIAEDELHPYELGTNGIRLKEMKYFKLPWPTEILRSLGNATVRMRCTLSYFVEPDPQAASRDRMQERYPSHRLKFDVKRWDETDAHAQRRLNALAPDDGTDGSNDEGWMVSNLVQRGTLHQNDWTGPAYQLAERDGISVAPIRGWWGDMGKIDNYERPARFTLIVSIMTPEETGDLVAGLRLPAGTPLVMART